jgi:hypothetical protein
MTFLNCPGDSDRVATPADAAWAIPIAEPTKPPASAIAPPIVASEPGSINFVHLFLGLSSDGHVCPGL